MEIQMYEPYRNVAFQHGNIQIRHLILLEMVMDVAKHMSAIHRTQLLNVRAQYNNRSGFNGSSHYLNENYLTKGDFMMLGNIFKRYREQLETFLGEDDLKKMTVGFIEFAEHETYIDELIEKNKSVSSDSNFSIVSRGQEPA